MPISETDWRFDLETGYVVAPGSRSDRDGKHLDYKFPRIIAELPDDWDQRKHGLLIAAANQLKEALEIELKRARASYSNTPAGEAAFSEKHAKSLAAISKATSRQPEGER